MEIREMRKDDISEIVKIYEGYHKEDSKTIKNVYTKYYESKSKKNSNNIQDYVLLENNKIIAFSGYNKETTETQDIYWINWTGVDKVFQNKGYGTILLKYIISKLKELNARKIYVSTSTQKEYKIALRFYKKIGFQIEGRLTNYYKDGVDMIMLGLELRYINTFNRIKNKLKF